MSGNAKPDISVLMAVYNGEKFISESIDSILNQTFEDFELIIVDDCSTDGSAEVINQYKDSRIKYYRNRKNLGQTLSLNKGIELAQGTYIARIDHDDVSHKRRLERQLDFLESNPDHALCGTLAKVISENGKKIYTVRSERNDSEYLKCKLFFENVIFHSSAFFSTQLAKKWLYDSSFTIAQDYDLWIKFGQSHKIGVLNEQLVSLRKHRDNASELLSETGVREVKDILGLGLKRLNIDYHPSELELHYKMCSESLKPEDNINRLNTWISKIIKKNLEHGEYNPTYFRSFIVKKLINSLLKFSYRNRSFPLLLKGLKEYNRVESYRSFSNFRKAAFITEFMLLEILKKSEILKYRLLSK